MCGLYSLRFFCFPSKFIKAARPPGLWVVDWLEILSVDKLSFGLNCVHACINTHFIKRWWWQRCVCLHPKGIFSLSGYLWCQLELVRSSWDAAEQWAYLLHCHVFFKCLVPLPILLSLIWLTFWSTELRTCLPLILLNPKFHNHIVWKWGVSPFSFISSRIQPITCTYLYALAYRADS